MHFVIPNFQDLDGWDALVFVVAMVTGAALGASGAFTGLGTACGIVAGAFVCSLRRALWPQPARRASHHNGLTLLAVSVGGVLSAVALFAEVAIVSFLARAKGASASMATLFFPAPVLGLGLGLVYVGWRYSRRKNVPNAS